MSDTVLMTLAGNAYGAPTSIARYLDEAAPTANDWSMAWLAAPPDLPVNFAFMARSATTGVCVVAIRGTLAARRGAARGPSLTIASHSLGGTLAPVLALYLSRTNSALKLSVTSFAGMTPGNAAFAALFGPGTVLDGQARRVFNTIDSVFYGWDKVFATHDFFDPAPKGSPVVAAMLLATAARFDLGGYDYAAIGTPVPLQGVVQKPAIDCTLVAYVIETLHQHMPDTYLALLGAPLLPFSILFGNVVMPRDHAVAVASGSAFKPATIYMD